MSEAIKNYGNQLLIENYIAQILALFTNQRGKIMKLIYSCSSQKFRGFFFTRKVDLRIFHLLYY